MTGAIELLPCPFCGSSQVSASMGEKGDGTPWPYVECESCACCAEPHVWNRRAALATNTQQAPEPEPVAWRYKDSRGHWRYTGNTPDAYHVPILKPEPLYLAARSEVAKQAPEPSERAYFGGRGGGKAWHNFDGTMTPLHPDYPKAKPAPEAVEPLRDEQINTVADTMFDHQSLDGQFTPRYDRVGFREVVGALLAHAALSHSAPETAPEPTLADVIDALNVFNPGEVIDGDGARESWVAEDFIAVTALPAFVHSVGRAWYSREGAPETAPVEAGALTDEQVFALMIEAGWGDKNRGYMTPKDQAIFCERQRRFLALALRGSASETADKIDR